jgi:predicted enzyme related to lactoylglutathione lyase
MAMPPAAKENEMPTRDRAPAGAPCWVDLMTSDVDGARAFYAQVLGWSAEAPNEEFGGYFSFLKDGVAVAGCMRNQSGGEVPDMWGIYLCSNDADATLARAAELGGQVVVPSMKVGELGTMAVILDPGGAAIGVWAPIGFHGFGVYDEPGTPKWFELHTTAYDTAVNFYRRVFEWETQVAGDSPEFRYTTAVHDGENIAGVIDASSYLPEGVPSHWVTYFGVPSVDDAVVKIADLGGSVVMAAQDTPYGRLAAVADPTGVQFRILEANA